MSPGEGGGSDETVVGQRSGGSDSSNRRNLTALCITRVGVEFAALDRAWTDGYRESL